MGSFPETLMSNFANIQSVTQVKEGGFQVSVKESDGVTRTRYVPNDISNQDFATADQWFRTHSHGSEIQLDPLQTDTGDDTGI